MLVLECSEEKVTWDENSSCYDQHGVDLDGCGLVVRIR